LEIGNHIDTRGNDDFNLRMTEMRAKNISSYLISLGMDQSRLIPIGYGESTPYNTSEMILKETDKTKQEEMHIANRRTTFKIIKK
jgi:outer membrane protein OmpA-like peptidoglycan-associated protein